MCDKYFQASALKCLCPSPRACTSSRLMMAYMSSQGPQRGWEVIFNTPLITNLKNRFRLSFWINTIVLMLWLICSVLQKDLKKTFFHSFFLIHRCNENNDTPSPFTNNPTLFSNYMPHWVSFKEIGQRWGAVLQLGAELILGLEKKETEASY